MVGQLSRSPNTPARSIWLNQSSLIYEDEYILLALISALDVVISFFYLQYGGHLFTNFVDTVISQTGMYGLLAFKLLIVALMVFTCETLGHRNAAVGRKAITVVNLLAVVALSVVVYEFTLLLLN